jgi:integrase
MTTTHSHFLTPADIATLTGIKTGRRGKSREQLQAEQLRDLRAKAGTDIGNPQQAQRLLGHSGITMTEHYIRNRRGDFVKPII